MPPKSRLNLKRSPVTYVLVGLLLTLIGCLVFVTKYSWPEYLIFGSILTVSGLINLTFINRLSIDAGTQELVHHRGAIVPMWSRRYPLKKIRSIRITKKVVRKGKSSRVSFPVELNGIKDAVILKHGSPWFSRVRAEQLARMLEVPLVNRVYGVTSTRNSDELDLPLVERWIRDGERFEKPSLAHDSTLQETIDGTKYELSIGAEFPALIYLILPLVLLVLPAAIPNPLEHIFHSSGYRIFATIAAIAVVMLLAFVGRSTLRITPTDISFRQGYFPKRHHMPLADVEELVVAGDGVTLIGDTSAVWVHWGKSKRESEYIEAVIPYQMLRLGRHGRANYHS